MMALQDELQELEYFPQNKRRNKSAMATSYAHHECLLIFMA